MMFEERLQRIASNLEDVQVVALIAEDGIPVEIFGSAENLDVETLAAELVTQVRTIGENHGGMAMGPVRHLAITTDQQTLMMGALTAGYFLLLALGSGSSFGRARFELRRAPIAFDPDLE